MPTWVVVVGIVLWAALQYGLAVWALRDLQRRPRVRGDNKTLWALVILAVPVVGPLAYATYGPTSFLPRPPRAAAPAPDDPAAWDEAITPAAVPDAVDEPAQSEAAAEHASRG